MTLRTFLRAHWQALVAADFFSTEVWTPRGLVTYYTATPHPDEAFLVQTLRNLTDVDGVLGPNRVLICDHDRNWSAATRFLKMAGVRAIWIPHRAPNCNAHAERFVRSLKEECLDRLIPIGERQLRRTLNEYVAHYHGERNHQSLDNELIDRPDRLGAGGPARRRERLGGVLSYYYRAAA
jgi:putative transposase